MHDQKPWFVHISYLAPHPPFVVPEPYHAMYDPAEVPPPLRAASPEDEAPPSILSSTCASHLSHPGCIKNADRSAGTGDGTIFAVRRA